MKRPARPSPPEVEREFLLAFWKLHILHHASEEAVVGQWLMHELRSHGYEVSPGTPYPLLARMKARGWLGLKPARRRGPRARKEYVLTRDGRVVLTLLRRRLRDLYDEVVGEAPGRRRSAERRRTRR